MDIAGAISDAIANLLRPAVKVQLEGMFEVINGSVGHAGKELSKDPETWNSGMFSLLRNVSINAVVPIAVIILTLVVCYDLVSSFIDKSMRDIDVEIVIKFVFKAFIGIFILNHTFDITMGVFAMGQNVVNKAIEIFGDSSVITADLYNAYSQQIEDMGAGGLLVALIEITFINIISLAVSAAVIAITTARMIEIYIFCSAAPIPFATLTNREWGSVGTNYIKNIFALSFQAFFMMICVGLYSGLVNNIVISNTDTLNFSLIKCMALSLVLIFMLFKCGSISKSIFNAL